MEAKNDDTIPKCNTCFQEFISFSDLFNHLKEAHQSSNTFICHICEKSFSSKSNLKKHEKNLHSLSTPSLPKTSSPKTPKQFRNLSCSECKESFHSRKDITDHFKTSHEIPVNVANLSFNDEETYNAWKLNIEKDTMSKFILNKTYNVSSGKMKKILECHRNGKYKSQSTGKRHPKILGSNKLDHFCPASIILTSHSSESLFPAEVMYCSTHIGHQCEVGRLPLSGEEKNSLAGQLLLGVPMQQVLHRVTEVASPTKRFSVTNMQDLRNISKKYGISSHIVRHKDDIKSVECWLKEMSNGPDNPVLFSKLPGELGTFCPGLQENDFALAFMNDAQEEILRSYGSDVVCIDSTHGTNKYNVQLYTLLVKDSNCQGFPVAFLWSNRQTEELFYSFFSAIKDRLGDNIKPETFLTDDYIAFYNAWVSVFGETKYYLLCDWHVRRALKNSIVKGQNGISDATKREEVIAKIFGLINEMDEVIFNKKLKDIIEELGKDELTEKYCRYFVSHYASRPKQWAFCYRLDAHINTNMALERWHRELKYNSDLRGKCGGRLDKAIHSLIKSLRLKLLDRLTTLARGKVTKKVLTSRKNHQVANEILDSIDVLPGEPGVWIVPSFTTPGKNYYVKSLKPDRSHFCNIVCIECDTCLHQFKCSCPDSAIKYNFCKHIHLACLKSAAANNQVSDCESDTDTLEIVTDTCVINQKSVIAKELKRDFCSSDAAKAAFLSFCSKFESYDTEEQRREIAKTLTELQHKCEAMAEKKRVNLAVTQSAPHNKNMSPQRKFPPRKRRKL